MNLEMEKGRLAKADPIPNISVLANNSEHKPRQPFAQAHRRLRYVKTLGFRRRRVYLAPFVCDVFMVAP